jgi:N-acetylglucosamine-6-phosphate deacetylase
MDQLTVTGATVFTPSERLVGANVQVEGGKISWVSTSQPPSGGSRQIDATGLLLVPGLIELQINGAFGQDITSVPESIWEVAQGLPRFGVTCFLPTIVTSPLERIARAQAALLAGPPPGFHGATPLGLHVEGPFLNPERKGAHREEYLRQPDPAELYNFSPKTGIRMITLAPELPGALELIAELDRQGVVVSAGHSMATLTQAREAFAAGVSYATHLFNAMPPLHQFDPGLVGAVLDDPGLRFGLIADGIHVHPTLVNLVWKLAGPGRMTLVSDAMAALGHGPGHYPLGEHQKVIVDETSARLPNGVLAGSILSHPAALRNLMAFTGCTFEEALACLTTTPASLLGMDAEIGQIANGYRADFALLTSGLDVVQTFVNGRPIYPLQI